MSRMSRTVIIADVENKARSQYAKHLLETGTLTAAGTLIISRVVVNEMKALAALGDTVLNRTLVSETTEDDDDGE